MIGIRAQALVPFTKEALIFGGVHGFIKIENGKLEPVASSSAAVNRVLSVSSDEVRLCAKRASFIGKWFASSGSAATILALLGVRP
jgi:hypothetical protein